MSIVDSSKRIPLYIHVHNMSRFGKIHKSKNRYSYTIDHQHNDKDVAIKEHPQGQQDIHLGYTFFNKNNACFPRQGMNLGVK